jgi:hypothetical protein
MSRLKEEPEQGNLKNEDDRVGGGAKESSVLWDMTAL